MSSLLSVAVATRYLITKPCTPGGGGGREVPRITILGRGGNQQKNLGEGVEILGRITQRSQSAFISWHKKK